MSQMGSIDSTFPVFRLRRAVFGRAFRRRLSGICWVLLAFLCAAITPPAHCRADWVELSTGGSVTGDVAIQENRPVLIRTPDNIVVAIPASSLRRRMGESDLGQYQAARKVAGVDPELNEQLSRWCRVRGNLPMLTKQYRDFHLWRVVHQRPKDSAAWAVLGYKAQGDQFVPVDDLMRDRGMVRVRGGWDMPEVVMRDRQADADETAAKKWIQDIARLVKTIQRGSGRVDESIAELSAIDDPLATLGIAESFQRLGRGNQAIAMRNLRRILLDKLIEFGNGLTIRTLVRAGLDDPDPIMREVSLRALAQDRGGRSSAIATYLPMLKSNVNAQVNQAAAALVLFPDPELDLTYTDALVTEHREVIAPGAGINTSFGGSSAGNGGGGLSTGGKAQVLVRNLQNPAVLNLLRTIAPNVNFGYDQQAWRDYFIGLRTASPGDLRADLPARPVANP